MSFVLMDLERHDRGMNRASLIPAGQATVVIRIATPADHDELSRLAALDSARALRGTVLVAQSDGRIRAAYSVEEGRAIADPFVPTAGLVELLHTRSALLHDGHRAFIRPRRRRPRLAAAARP
jgi:hypothetical protein